MWVALGSRVDASRKGPLSSVPGHVALPSLPHGLRRGLCGHKAHFVPKQDPLGSTPAACPNPA